MDVRPAVSPSNLRLASGAAYLDVALRIGARWASDLGGFVTAIEEARGGDVVVVGAPPRALGDARALLVGPTPCDVLVARRPYAAGPIVVAYDGSQESSVAVTVASALARHCGAGAVALHAVAGEPCARSTMADRAERLRASLAADGDVELRIVDGPPDLALVAAERELGARLLVVARAADTARVAAAATGPVLVVGARPGH